MTHAPRMDELMGIVGVPLQLTLTLIKSMDSALTEVNSSQDSTLKAKIICSKKNICSLSSS